MLRKMWTGAEVQAWINENVLPASVGAEPIYLVNRSSWRAVDKTTFDLFPDYNRCIAFSNSMPVEGAEAAPK